MNDDGLLNRKPPHLFMGEGGEPTDDPKFILDTEAGPVLNPDLVVVAGENHGLSIAEACRVAQESGKKLVVVDSYSELDEIVDKAKLVEKMPRGLAKAAAIATVMGGLGWGIPMSTRYWHHGINPTKCGLPSCDKVVGRDYCCAEHCIEHRRIQREARKK